jgi:hypothetical protein
MDKVQKYNSFNKEIALYFARESGFWNLGRGCLGAQPAAREANS